MGNRILTFLVVFVGIFLLMRTCSPKPVAPQGLPVERPDDLPEGKPLQAGGATVLLAPDGSVASIVDGARDVMRPVRAGRRPFHVHAGRTEEPRRLPDAGWTSEELPEGGRKFVLVADAVRVEKTVRLLEDGKGLVLDLKAEGVPGLILTGASGAPMSGTGAPFAFFQYAGKEPQRRTYSELKQEREANRGRLYAAFEEPIGERVSRFGLFGSEFALALEEPPGISKFYMDVYRAGRAEGETDEAETWLDLVAPEGRFEGSFTLRWAPREEAAKAFPSADLEEGNDVVLEDPTFRIVFAERGAAIKEMWLKSYSTVAGEAPSERTWIPILGGSTPEGERALTLSLRGRAGIADRVWKSALSADGRSIRFTLALGDGWTLWKHVALPPAGRFDVEVEVGVEAPPGTTGQAILPLVGPSGGYIVDSYRGIIGAEAPAAFVLERHGEDETKTIEDLKKGELTRGYADDASRGLFLAIGTRGTYFVCALVSEDPKNAVTDATAKRITLDKPQQREDREPPTADSMLGRVILTLQLDGGRASQKFRLYAGPNETSALRELRIEKCVNFGFFGFIGRALMWLMKALHGLVASYGIAIMLLTVIVRALLLPISFKTQLSMQRYGKKMQKIKPLLDEVQKKHAKDPARMNQERMKIMREHGMGLPLGCLTIFLQIPIWFALFQALRVEFALRHQTFLWVADLSMPDRLLHLPFWPHWFNLLPILMLVLWVIQQRLTPTPGSDDPQVQMQMKMMRFMPYVFFFFLYNYAAGLSLYMCVSSCWSIAESKLVRRAIAKLG